MIGYSKCIGSGPFRLLHFATVVFATKYSRDQSNAKLRQKEKASLLSWELKVNNPFFLRIKTSYLSMV